MSPDIEWHIGEESERETVARVERTPKILRRWGVIMAIGLGAGLGLLYRSIPESSPQPIGSTPIPAVVTSPVLPLPTLESLETALQRDAFHLATSPEVHRTFDAALGRLPQAYADWYAALQNAPGGWEREMSQPPVTVYETGTLPSGVVWAKVGQFRNNDFFRHTRFYRRQGDRWVWTLPDHSFWKGATAAVMSGDAGEIGPITIGHPIEDAPMIGAVFGRFTRAYLNLCESLKCPPPADPARLWTPGLTLAIAIQPALTQPDVHARRGTLRIALPSPRVVGYYEDANTPGDPFVAMAYAILIDPIVRLASGDYTRWETDRGGELFLQAIAAWKRARVREELQPLELFYPASRPLALAQNAGGQPVSKRESYANALRYESRLPLDTLWDWPIQGRGFGLLQHVAVNEVEAVVGFIEDRYGEDGVVRFLNTLGQSRSLEEALEAALPVSFGEFNRQWMQWIGGD